MTPYYEQSAVLEYTEGIFRYVLDSSNENAIQIDNYGFRQVIKPTF